MNGDQILLRKFVRDGGPLKIESSPIAAAMSGYVVDVQSEPAKVELSFEPNDTFTQAANVIQGGIVATMLDLAMAFVALHQSADGYSVATANLNVSYFRATKAGKVFVGAEIERFGRNLIFARAAARSGDGLVVASATSTMSALAPR